MARPKKYFIEKMIPIIDKYIKDTEMPIVKELCFLNDWNYKRIYMMARLPENEELSDRLDKLISKKEVFLEKGLLSGHLKPAPAIFSLKQLGWREEYFSDEQKEQISLNNKLTAKNTEIAEQKLSMMKGDTDLTQIKDFLVEVKNVVDGK